MINSFSFNKFTFIILDSILGGSMSSHLFQEIREKKGLAYSVFSNLSSLRDFGTFYIYAGTSKENYIQIIDIILREFSQIKKQGISKEELERAREYIKGTLVLGLETTNARMNWMARSEFYHGYIHNIDEVFNNFDKVTLDDIINVAEMYIQNKFLSLAIIGNIEKLPFKEIKC